MHLADFVHFRGEQCDDDQNVTFAQAALDQCRHNGMDLFQAPHFAEQSQFIASFRTSNGGGARSSCALSGEEEGSDVVAVDADKDDWDYDGVMTADEEDGTIRQGTL